LQVFVLNNLLIVAVCCNRCG